MLKSIDEAAVAHLGEGIYVLNDDYIADLEVEMRGKQYYRFLDKLLLPAKTDMLTRSQIVIINRYREKLFKLDKQFRKNRQAHKFVHQLLNQLGRSSVLEIGCGKFPLVADEEWVPDRQYLCIDIDSEAVASNLKRGIPCSLLGDEDDFKTQDLDVCVAIFVFHFGVGGQELKLIDKLLRNDGVLIFNVNTHYASIKMAVVEKLGEHGYWGITVSGKRYGLENDTLFVMSKRPEGLQTLVEFVNKKQWR